MIPSLVRLALVLLFLLPATAGAGETQTVAVFPVKFTTPDRSPPDEAERRRLAILENELREAFEAAGYRVLDPQPLLGEVDIADFSRDCLDCEIELARKLDAEYATIGWVEKRNNLQLAITLLLAEVASGRTVREGSAIIRGNMDETWKRGLRFILKYQILPAE